jgi:putative Flp pilus-assembly TadE/G-like protein
MPRLPASKFHRIRRGSATLWMVIWLPCLLVMFLVMVGVANLWLARVELENALEASALAAVKQWGDASGGDTFIPRRIGQAYAAANCVRGNPTVIGLNYNAAGGPNQNDLCEPTDETVSPPNGNLVFGTIDDSNPNNIIFNAGIAPSCAAGTVLLDATAQGPGNLAQDNAWGISFQCSPDTPPALRIVKIIINLQAGGGTGQFTLTNGPPDGPTISDNLPVPIISETCNQTTFSQPDLVGFPNPTAQIVFTPTTGLTPTLTIDFFPSGGDDGFAPGDRFRFGAQTTGVSSGNGQDDGDGIGRDGVTATVFFELGGVPLPPVTGTFFDNNTEGTNDCFCPPHVSPCDGSLIVNPLNIPNLPCPPASANNNNGQSFVLISGAGNRKFGVRAQSIFPVQTLGGFSFLGNITQYCIKVKTTAEYDCATRRPKLTRVHTYICPGPMDVVKTCKCLP